VDACDVVTMRAPEYLLTAADHSLYKCKEAGPKSFETTVEIAQPLQEMICGRQEDCIYKIDAIRAAARYRVTYSVYSCL
jgi:hypothetical protein